MADKDVTAMLAAFGAGVQTGSVTSNGSPALDVDSGVPGEIFAPSGWSAATLPDAIETATALVEDLRRSSPTGCPEPASSSPSVVTAGARRCSEGSEMTDDTPGPGPRSLEELSGVMAGT